MKVSSTRATREGGDRLCADVHWDSFSKTRLSGGRGSECTVLPLPQYFNSKNVRLRLRQWLHFLFPLLPPTVGQEAVPYVLLLRFMRRRGPPVNLSHQLRSQSGQSG